MTAKDTSKRPLGFVNRRGNNADVSSDDLEGLSIDTQPTAPVDDTTTPNPKAKTPKKKPSRRGKKRFTWSRKRTIITVSIVAAVVLIPIIFGEIMRAQYNSSTESAQASVQNIIKNDVMPLQQQETVTSKQMSEVTVKLETVRDDMCPGGLLDNASKLYPRSQEAYDACIAERGEIAGVATQMRDMTSMLAYIENTNAALAIVITPSTDEFAVIATQQSNWQQATAALEKVSPPTQLKPSYDQLLIGSKQITDGWSKLNTANNDQDAAVFQAAEAQLAEGYAAVRSSNDTAKTAINEKQTNLTQQAAKLTN